jgi:hypothetical protein
MADGARGSNALGWMVIGFLGGVAVTLGVLTILGPGHGRHRSDATEETIAPPPSKVAEDVAPRPAPKPAAPVVSAAPPVANSVDQQVQEDAAAAGMTSRRQSPADAPQN